MFDIELVYDKNHELDINVISNDLALSENLVNRILISLFTWAAPGTDDIIPDGIASGGYWGDNVPSFSDDVPEKMGSRLWLLDGKITDDTSPIARSYASDALAWMANDADVVEYNISVQRNGIQQLDLMIDITLNDGTPRKMGFVDFLNWGK